MKREKTNWNFTKFQTDAGWMPDGRTHKIMHVKNPGSNALISSTAV